MPKNRKKRRGEKTNAYSGRDSPTGKRPKTTPHGGVRFDTNTDSSDVDEHEEPVDEEIDVKPVFIDGYSTGYVQCARCEEVEKVQRENEILQEQLEECKESNETRINMLVAANEKLKAQLDIEKKARLLENPGCDKNEVIQGCHETVANNMLKYENRVNKLKKEHGEIVGNLRQKLKSKSDRLRLHEIEKNNFVDATNAEINRLTEELNHFKGQRNEDTMDSYGHGQMIGDVTASATSTATDDNAMLDGVDDDDNQITYDGELEDSLFKIPSDNEDALLASDNEDALLASDNEDEGLNDVIVPSPIVVKEFDQVLNEFTVNVDQWMTRKFINSLDVKKSLRCKIFRDIFQYLRFTSLKNCRVDKETTEEAREFFAEKAWVHLSIQVQMDRFHNDAYMLANVRNFKIKQFKMKNLIAFFQEVFIHRISLDHVGTRQEFEEDFLNRPSVSGLTELILCPGWASDLISQAQDESSYTSMNFSKALKHLRLHIEPFSSTYYFWMNIIECAGCLETVQLDSENVDCSTAANVVKFLLQALNDSKVGTPTITSLNLPCLPENTENLFRSLANKGVNLKSLTVDQKSLKPISTDWTDYAIAATTCNNILTAFSETLTSFTLSGIRKPITLNFPEQGMPKLKTLYLSAAPTLSGVIKTSSPLIYESMFPRLQELHLVDTKYRSTFHRRSFLHVDINNTPCETLTSLTVSSGDSIENEIAAIFPSLRNLTAYNIKDKSTFEQVMTNAIQDLNIEAHPLKVCNDDDDLFM